VTRRASWGEKWGEYDFKTQSEIARLNKASVQPRFLSAAAQKGSRNNVFVRKKGGSFYGGGGFIWAPASSRAETSSEKKQLTNCSEQSRSSRAGRGAVKERSMKTKIPIESYRKGLLHRAEEKPI